MRKNFPEMVNDDEDGDEVDDDEEDDDEDSGGRKKKAKKKAKKAKGGKNKKKNKKAQDEDNQEEDGDRSEKDGDEDDEESLEDSDEASEKGEEPVLSVPQQLKTFNKTAALGQLFLKYTGRRRRKPQDRIVKVTFGEGGAAKQISWGSGSRHIDFDDVVYIAWGHWTPVFQARKDQLDPELCFSVVSKSQILDVQANSKEMVWVKGLRKLIGQTDEQANNLSKEGLENETFGGPTQPKKEKDKVNNKEQKKRARSLMLLQQDLFVMTTTTVFRNLEEERIWDIDQSVRDQFNAKVLYEEALKQDIPWRQWSQWVRERVVTYLKENNRVTIQQYNPNQFVVQQNYPQPVVQPGYPPVQQTYQQPIQTPQTFVHQQSGTIQTTQAQSGQSGQSGQPGQQDEACTLM